MQVVPPGVVPEPARSKSDSALRGWREDASDTVITAAVVLHLPAVLLLLAADLGPVFSTVAVAGYLASVVIALLRGIDHEIRVWALLGLLYAVATIGMALHPDGPYTRALPLVAPLLAVTLIDRRAASVATAISTVLLVGGPFLHWVPAVTGLLGTDHPTSPVPYGTLLLQGVALTGEMLILVVLLDRFYGFLHRALVSERRATSERSAVNRRLAAEIEQRHHLERELAELADHERRNLGNEIHDGVCQQLAGALLRCQAIELRLERGTPPDVAEVEALSSLLVETINEARAVAKGLGPLDTRPDALVPALAELARHAERTSDVRCEMHVAGNVRVSNPTAAHHLYRITQEALSNAVRHARARAIGVELVGSDAELVLQVDDDGIGPPRTGHPSGLGLRTMAYRARLLDGELSIGPGPAGGTRVWCRVPRAAIAFPTARPSEGSV